MEWNWPEYKGKDIEDSHNGHQLCGIEAQLIDRLIFSNMQWWNNVDKKCGVNETRATLLFRTRRVSLKTLASNYTIDVSIILLHL